VEGKKGFTTTNAVIATEEAREAAVLPAGAAPQARAPSLAESLHIQSVGGQYTDMLMRRSSAITALSALGLVVLLFMAIQGRRTVRRSRGLRPVQLPV